MHLRTASINGAIIALGLLTSLNLAQAGPAEFATKINFSGHVWDVKSSQQRVGPGPNWFSDRKENVWVDDAGKLHLKVSQTDGQWHCAEIICEDSLGFGTYRFEVATPLGTFDPNLILGLYTWSNTSDYANREIDIECSKWGNTNDVNNAQFVVQPFPPTDRRVRFCVPDKLETATYSFTWHASNVQFSCYPGLADAADTNAVIRKWNFAAGSVPPPGDECVHMNLWLLKGRTPMNAHEAEIVVSKFEFVPDTIPANAKNGS